MIVRSLIGLTFYTLFLTRVAFAAPTPDEIALDDHYYANMERQHKIVHNATEQRVVNRIGARISLVASSIYHAPFTFYVVDSDVPNAFVAFASRVYVDRGLLKFVANNADEFAAVLCHEMSHAIHHDGIAAVARVNRLGSFEDWSGTRLKRAFRGRLDAAIDNATATGDALILSHYTRGDEERADLRGSDICAAAGFNPWGFVWLFRKFNANARTAAESRWLSDHPTYVARIKALERHFAWHRKTFGLYHDDISHATPLM